MNGKVGIGLRREIAGEILEEQVLDPDFLEFAPENWMGLGGNWRRVLDRALEKHAITCHGLSLSLGSVEELDRDFIRELKAFLDDCRVEIYSEHLSYTKSQNAHLYDFLPIPFREDAVRHVSQRIREVQDYLERPIAIENVSYYTPVAAEMTEAEFICAILEESNCQLLLDVNNVYVNAFNHNYDARGFISSLPLDRVANVVHDALESAFPIAAASLEQELWTSLVDEFFEEGAPRSPRIWRMPFEFYSFHVNRESGIKLGLDWLDDLLFFEWMEIEIYNMPDRDFPALASDGDLMADRLVFNPEHEIIRLEYPVHQLDVSEAGKEKGDYYVLIYRSPET